MVCTCVTEAIVCYTLGRSGDVIVSSIKNL